MVGEASANEIFSGWAWALTILVMAFAACIRIRLLGIPLERDEGEFAYMGQLILRGIPPYLHAYTMKLPGTHAAYALVMGVLGQTVEAIHIGFMLLNAATTLVLFLLVRRLFGNLAGLGAGAAFALLSLSPSVLGTSAHATHFVLLPALCGLLVLVKARERIPAKTLVFSGFLLGIGTLMKQPGLFFVALAVFIVISDRHRTVWIGIRRGLLLVFGAVLPYAGACLILWAWGTADRFWFWTVKYGLAYSSILPLSAGRELLYSQFPVAASSGAWLWILAGAGIVTLPVCAKRTQTQRFALAFLIFSFLAVCPGFYFRRHYWILLLPAIAMFAGIALQCAMALAARLTSRRFILILPLGLLFSACAATIGRHFDFFFRMTPNEACRALYGSNPFPEAAEIGQYIYEHTSQSDTLAVIGSEPEIYFYSRRLSATGHIYTYGMMESQPYANTMQKDMIGEIEASRPRYLVFVDFPLSWLVSSESDRHIFTWFERYRVSHYQTVRVLKLATPPSVVRSSTAISQTPRSTLSSSCQIEILERIGS